MQCEDGLSQVATNVTELLAELHRLRTESEALGRTLADRETLVQQQRSALARHETERSQLRQQAELASEALRAADADRRERDARMKDLQRELDTVRAGIEGRERRLGELDADYERLRDTLAEREDELERTRVEAAAALLHLTDARRHRASDGRASPLGHVRLIARPSGYALTESEEPCPVPGDLVDVGVGEGVVTRVGPSPLPGDKRRCAVVVIAPI